MHIFDKRKPNGTKEIYERCTKTVSSIILVLKGYCANPIHWIFSGSDHYRSQISFAPMANQKKRKHKKNIAKIENIQCVHNDKSE